MKKIFDLEKTTVIPKDNSYIASYPCLLNYFAEKETLSKQDVVCGAHMIYGWMPTILELHPTGLFDFSTAAALLNKAKSDVQINDTEIEKLARLINNSLVGASKLLHFVAPHKFAIWDSKIFQFVFNEKPYQYRMSKIGNYLHYLTELKSLQNDARFDKFYESVNDKIGYNVSPLRALELVMFLNSPADS